MTKLSLYFYYLYSFFFCLRHLPWRQARHIPILIHPRVRVKGLPRTRVIKQFVTGIPRGARDYAKIYKRLVTPAEYDEAVIPQIVPQWDHSPRSGDKANVIFYNSQPKYFADL